MFEGKTLGLGQGRSSSGATFSPEGGEGGPMILRNEVCGWQKRETGTCMTPVRWQRVVL